MTGTLESKSAKDGAVTKFLMSLLDRAMFIGIGVAGTVATTYITGIMKLNPPKLIATQSYARVDSSREVPGQVGSLKLDYETDTPLSWGVYRVAIANDGRGAAERVKFQVKIPPALAAAYESPPDFKVYSPTQVAFDKNEFYAELAHFPSGAGDSVAFRIDGDEALLCGARVKLVNDEYEGDVGAVKGVEGCR